MVRFILAQMVLAICLSSCSNAPSLNLTSNDKAERKKTPETAVFSGNALVRRERQDSSSSFDAAWAKMQEEPVEIEFAAQGASGALGVLQRKRSRKFGFGQDIGFGRDESGFPGEKNAKLVRVFFGTSRSIKTADDGQRYFTDQRSRDLTTGFAIVSVPFTHKIGRIEVPNWIEGRNDEKHFALKSLNDTDRPYFEFLLTSEAKREKKNRVLIYVHGVSNTFETAAFRAAQIKLDTGFRGPVVFFSWPTGSWFWQYNKASNEVDWSSHHLASFLTQLMGANGIDEAMIIVHSLGARLVSAAVKRMKKGPKKVRELILASPDIDSQVFARDIAPAVSAFSQRTTIYTSYSDRALGLSALFSSSRRLGQAPSAPALAKFDVIDTAKVASDGLFKHSDFTESRPAMTDLSYLVNLSLPVEKRHGLRQVTKAGQHYWELQP